MLGFGGLEVLVFMVVLYVMVAFALYWIIRLAVRHGIDDSRRVARGRESAAGVRETIRRQQASYDDGSSPRA